MKTVNGANGFDTTEYNFCPQCYAVVKPVKDGEMWVCPIHGTDTISPEPAYVKLAIRDTEGNSYGEWPELLHVELYMPATIERSNTGGIIITTHGQPKLWECETGRMTIRRVGD